jgi:hypothetical protein
MYSELMAWVTTELTPSGGFMYDKKHFLGLAIGMFLVVFITTPCSATPTQPLFSFENGTSGWTIAGSQSGYALPFIGYTAPDFDATNGNSGGTISTVDRYTETFFSIPPEYLGNQSGAFGTNITFDIKISYSDNATYPAVILVGQSKVLYFNMMSTIVGQWETRNIPLKGQGWKLNSWQGADATDEDMKEVLSNLSGCYINAEWMTGPDTTYLDNVSFFFSNTQTYTLTVTIDGTGGGNINSNTGVTICPGACSTVYDAGTSVLLLQAANSNSTFRGWNGPCTIIDGSCSVTMDSNKSVNATFNEADKIRIGAKPYTTLTAAFTDATNGPVLARAIEFNELLTVLIPTVLKGGHNAEFSDNLGNFSTLIGRLTIQNGSLTTLGLKIR